jgi:hypothetical protein
MFPSAYQLDDPLSPHGCQFAPWVTPKVTETLIDKEAAFFFSLWYWISLMDYFKLIMLVQVLYWTSYGKCIFSCLKPITSINDLYKVSSIIYKYIMFIWAY